MILRALPPPIKEKPGGQAGLRDRFLLLVRNRSVNPIPSKLQPARSLTTAGACLRDFDMVPRLSFDEAVQRAYNEGLHRIERSDCPACLDGLLLRHRKRYRCTNCGFTGNGRDLIRRTVLAADVALAAAVNAECL